MALQIAARRPMAFEAVSLRATFVRFVKLYWLSKSRWLAQRIFRFWPYYTGELHRPIPLGSKVRQQVPGTNTGQQVPSTCRPASHAKFDVGDSGSPDAVIDNLLGNRCLAPFALQLEVRWQQVPGTCHPFRQCNLCYVDLTSVVVDEKTSFEQADLFRATIAREVLDCMEGGGKLTMHQLRNLKVVDDIATLRREFSGFWVAVHVTGMLIFLAPYLVFVVFQLLRAEVGELQTSIGVELVSDKDTAPFGLNIIRFIASGGKNWRQWDVSFLAIVLTGLAILYNFLRGLLWWKTLSLEHHKLIHGYYPSFSFKGFWKLCFNSYRFSVVLGVIVLLVHSLMFLSRPIPV